MKILHTADWHLGKKLDFYSRLEEQKEVLEEICQIADREAVDVVLVAGDLFDAFNPSTEAIDLLYKTLKRLSQDGKRPVIAIAGNHDSPSLIDAPDPLARACGIILIGYPNAVVQPFELPGFKITQSVPGLIEIQLQQYDYPIRILHTAYANEARLKTYLGEEKDTALNEVLAHHWQETADAHCDENGVNVMVSHLYMMPRGGALIEEPEGERPIRIGNADMVYAEAVPQQIQYTALGHLHNFRNMGTDDVPIVYSSSILAYSFSKAGQQKHVAIAEIEPRNVVQLSSIPLQSGKSLERKTFSDIDLAVEWLEANQNSLVELTIESETFMSAADRKILTQAHQGIIHLIPKVKNTGISNDSDFENQINLSERIEVLFRDYFKSKNDAQEPSDEIMALFNEILNQD